MRESSKVNSIFFAYHLFPQQKDLNFQWLEAAVHSSQSSSSLDINDSEGCKGVTCWMIPSRQVTTRVRVPSGLVNVSQRFQSSQLPCQPSFIWIAHATMSTQGSELNLSTVKALTDCVHFIRSTSNFLGKSAQSTWFNDRLQFRRSWWKISSSSLPVKLRQDSC